MSVIPQGVPEEAAARKTLAFEGARRRLVAGRAGRVMLAIWGFVVAGLFLGHLAGVLGGVVAIAVAALGAAWMERSWARTATAAALAGSLSEISLGRLPEADGTLTALRDAFWLSPALARQVALQSALVATRRGELAVALENLDQVLALRREPGDVDAALQRESALALRAFVLAASGETERAWADIEAVRESEAEGEALARASLAEALILQRAGDRPGLRALLEADGPMLREHCHPRERVVVRALARWSRAPKITPYRHAEPATPAEELPVETWVERVAPDLAGFVEASPRTALGHAPLGPNLAAPSPTQAGLRAIRDARLARSSPLWPLVAIAGGAFGAMALLLVLSSPQGGYGADIAREGPAIGPIVMVVAALVAAALFANRRATRRTHEVQRANLTRAAGRTLDRQATSEVAALTASADGRTRAHAQLVLAQAAERAGRWHEVLERTATALRKIARRSDLPDLSSELISLRALALAATDRQGEAEAELAALPRGYPHAPRALFRARLVEAVRRDRLEPALAHIERYGADLPLSIREETLADMIRVVSGASTDGARIADDLAREPALLAWLDGVAPSLVARFEESDAGGGFRRGARVRLDERCEPADARSEARLEEARLAEALAEEECHQGSSSASTARLTS